MLRGGDYRGDAEVRDAVDADAAVAKCLLRDPVDDFAVVGLLILAERFPLALRLAGAAHIDRDGDVAVCGDVRIGTADRADDAAGRSEEHTSELQSLMRISYAVFCLHKKNK